MVANSGVGPGISPGAQPQTGRARFPGIRLSRMPRWLHRVFLLVAPQTQSLKVKQMSRLRVAGETANRFDMIRLGCVGSDL